MKIAALTRKPSPLLESGERTHVGRDAIDFARALAQHDAYRAVLRDLGAAERCLDDAAAFPDGVFIEDTAVVLDETAIITRPGAPSRRPEVPGVESALAAFREVRRIDSGTLDGGDVVVTGRRILVGRSARTDGEGIASLSRLTGPFGYRVTPVNMQGCLHLKTGCTALPDGRLLVNRNWIDVSPLGDFDLVDVPAAEPWGGDVGYVRNTVFAAAAYPRTLETLERKGYKVRAVDVSEFAKAEGGVTCMSVVFSAE